MQEGPGMAQVLAQGDGVGAQDHEGLGEVVRVLAAAVVRCWCQGDHRAAVRVYSALGVFLQSGRRR